jgi:hypothetical protein
LLSFAPVKAVRAPALAAAIISLLSSKLLISDLLNYPAQYLQIKWNHSAGSVAGSGFCTGNFAGTGCRRSQPMK